MLEIDNLRGGYVALVKHVYLNGDPVAPRGMMTKEVRGFTFRLNDPRDSIPYGVGRGIIMNIGAAEALQLIGGFSDPAGMVRVSPRFQQFQTAGVLHGAYGPRVLRQQEYVTESLAKDPDSRQAMMMVYDPWRDQHTNQKDVPCTIGLQFFLRHDENSELELEAHCMMRSNDVWLGLPYDVFQFTQLQLTVARLLGVKAGAYIHHASSLHIYQRDWNKVDGLHYNPGDPKKYVPNGIAGPGWNFVRQHALASWHGDKWVSDPEGSRWYRDQVRKAWEGHTDYEGEKL